MKVRPLIRGGRVLWFFIRPHRALYAGLLAIMLLCAALESLSISALFPLLHLTLADEAPVAGQALTAFDHLIRWLPFRNPLYGACLLVMLLLLLKEGLALARRGLTSYGAAITVCEMRETVFRAYLHREYEFFLNARQGELVYSTMQAPGKLGNYLQLTLDMLTALCLTLALGGLLFFMSWRVTLALAAVAFGFNLLTHALAMKVSYNLGRERVVVSRNAEVVLNEGFDGVKHIKVFGAVEMWHQRFARFVRRFREINIRDELWLAVPERVLNILPIGILLMVVLAAHHLRGTSPGWTAAQLPIIGVYAVAFYRLIPHLTSFGRFRMQIMGTFPDAELLYTLLHETPPTRDDAGVKLERFSEAIRFEDITFRYRGKPRDILRQVRFTVAHGTTTAIVGSSGAGKSTMAHLLTGLFEPTAGRITIDGVDLRQLAPSSLQRLIGLVSQETFIFHGTVTDNIRFNLADVPLERVVEAARIANAHEFIEGLPQGYETVVGDKGLKLSGGQRQRIALARVFLRDPAVLILDEATSALDYQAEFLVQQGIAALSKNRTVIIIAHRLSTIRHADHIVTLDDGRIVGEGVHSELMRTSPVYHRLYEGEELVTKSLEPEGLC